MGAACAGCWAYLLIARYILMQDIVTESNQFDLVGFIPLLRERIYSNNQYARQFIISWVGTHRATCAGIPCLGKQQMSTVRCEHRDLRFLRPYFKSATSDFCFFKMPAPCHIHITVAVTHT